MQEVTDRLERFTFTFEKDVDRDAEGHRPPAFPGHGHSLTGQPFLLLLTREEELEAGPTAWDSQLSPSLPRGSGLLSHILSRALGNGPGFWAVHFPELGSAVCNFFAKGLCEKGKLCPFRHNRGEKMLVCKHWLRGLCKKGDEGKFLPQYVTRMPDCYFFSKFGDYNRGYPFLHVMPAFKIQDCLWCAQGFCKDGPLCKYRHVHRIMCINYLAGFCPEGPKCQFAQ
ncbi:hypothetical protein MC885_004455 [Smutsia gigantea]|nr:hypothetical protein MC885_004455 [Smutsia gigantea]